MTKARLAGLSLLALLLAGSALADPLNAGFANPPPAARPRVWWHWLDGNVTHDGIAQDLAWMHAQGIAGFQMFNVSLGLPTLVQPRVRDRSPQWSALVGFAASEAARLHLEMAATDGPGWSETGGPWVTPDQAMKKLVWSEITISGGATAIHPPPAPSVSGPYQDFPDPAPFSLGPPAPRAALPTRTRPVAVVAYRLPASEVTLASLHPTLTSSTGPLNLDQLTNGSFAHPQTLPLPSDGSPAWVQLAFAQPVTLRALTLGLAFPSVSSPGIPASGQVQISDDGINFRPIASLAGVQPPLTFPPVVPVMTLALNARAARFYRVTLPPPPANPFAIFQSPNATAYGLTQLAFHPEPRVQQVQAKAGTLVAENYLAIATPSAAADQVIAPADVLDLTSKLRPDGTLDWIPPPGTWRILRFGSSLTGAFNHPANPESEGLEVDKLSAKSVRAYLDGGITPLLRAAGPNAGSNGLQALLNDSWEAGQANWTDGMRAEFRKRRGYDLVRYLPIFAGHIIGGATDSDRFLWDFRRTVAELLAENHYGTIQTYAHAHGLRYAAEATGPNQPTIADGFEAKRFTDVPMGEFWQIPPGQTYNPAYFADIEEAASAAHLYGQNIAAAESFTALPTIPAFSTSPWTLKPIADQIFAAGINRIAIHTSPAQPFDRGPGTTLGPFGQYFSRNEAWGPLAGGWINYLARASFLLQQGHYVADIAYFCGDGATADVTDASKLSPSLAPGYPADFFSTDALLRVMRVRDGKLGTDSGMTYRLLVLPASLTRLTLPVIVKLRELVQGGAILLGPKPVGSPSLGEDDQKIRAIADRLWGQTPGQTHRFGAGRVYSGTTIDAVMRDLSIAPDIDTAGTRLLTLHRHLPGADLWFIANPSDTALDSAPNFRVAGRQAEFFHPDTGVIDPARFAIASGRTTVPLHLGSYGSVFVVFRTATTAQSQQILPAQARTLRTLDGIWQVDFQPGRGAPPHARFDHLQSLTDNPDPAIRYFSGIATYHTTLTLSEIPTAGHLWLDLGRIGAVADISVNGDPASNVWEPPFRADVTGQLHQGANQLTIRVANLWPNRLIGDQQPHAGPPIAFSTYPFPVYHADSPLTPSGLIGPVRLLRVTP